MDSKLFVLYLWLIKTIILSVDNFLNGQQLPGFLPFFSFPKNLNNLKKFKEENLWCKSYHSKGNCNLILVTVLRLLKKVSFLFTVIISSFPFILTYLLSFPLGLDWIGLDFIGLDWTGWTRTECLSSTTTVRVARIIQSY